MAPRAARVDNNSKVLQKYAQDLGFVVVGLNTVVDCLLVWGSQVLIVDWKSPGALLTPAQQRLVAAGVPVKFISQPCQIDALKAELSR